MKNNNPSEKEIQLALFRFALWEKNHPIALYNSTRAYFWEADFLSITRSNFVHEYEIKRSRSDYLADFRNKKAKHDSLKNKNIFNDWYGQRKDTIPRIPNYFWFVTCEDIEIDPPDYAGWMKIKNHTTDRTDKILFPEIIKPAPRLHKEKIPEKRIVRLAVTMSQKLYRHYLREFGLS